jgi:peptidoglycan/LPS O-acetylase OafA/YrhL
MSPLHFVKELVLCRCAYHLYFVGLIVQLYFVLPVLVRLFRRRRPLWVVVAIASVVQVGVFFLNRYLMSTPLLHGFRQVCTFSIASTLAGYVLPVALGLWWMAEKKTSPQPFPWKGVPWITGLSTAAYVPIGVLALMQPVDTLTCQAAGWAYTSAASIALILVSMRLVRVDWLVWFGRHSLTVYLAHPFVIDIVDRVIPRLRDLHWWISMPVYVAAAIGGCALLARVGEVNFRSRCSDERRSARLEGRPSETEGRRAA